MIGTAKPVEVICARVLKNSRLCRDIIFQNFIFFVGTRVIILFVQFVPSDDKIKRIAGREKSVSEFNINY